MDWIIISKVVALFLYPLNIAIAVLCMAWLCILFSRKKTGLSLGLFAIVLLIVSASAPVASYFIKNLESRFKPYAAAQAPAADAIVLLGGALELPQPPRVDFELNGAADRVRYAAQLYHAGKAAKIIIAGGNVFVQPGVEAESYYMMKLLGEWGVPESAVVLESKSRNTYENALFVKPVLQSNGFERVLLVTSAVHMPRAHAVFMAQDVDAIAAPTDTQIVESYSPGILKWMPQAHALSGLSVALKEYIGYLYYYLRGYL